MSSQKNQRGALIVLEGCDRSGKTTQCKLLVEALKEAGVSGMRSPDRETEIGGILSRYLNKEFELDNHAVHLLFAANRWEKVPDIKKRLGSGESIIFDRYSYSGLAYSSAKEGMSLDWCKKTEIGLPAPDLVIYLDVKPEVAEKRGEYGNERYETKDFQRLVAERYKCLQQDTWKIIDANKGQADVHQELLQIVKDCINAPKTSDIPKMWQ